MTGELDSANDELYRTTLRRIWTLIDDDPIIIDTQQLQFVSHRQLDTLDSYASTDGRKIILSDRGIVTRIARVLDFTNLEVQPPANQTATPPTNPGLQVVPA